MRPRSIPLVWVLLAWVAVTALLALNRGIELLWGVTLLLVLAIVIAAVLPWLQTWRVQVRRAGFPATAVVGEPVTIGYEVASGRWFSRYGIEIHDGLGASGALTPAALLPAVRDRRTYSFAWTPHTRGCWQLRELRLESRYPLGLTTSSRRIACRAHEIVVYPDFVRLHWLPVRNDAHPRFEQMLIPRRGGHDEFFGTRPYVSSDDRRSIHWRASARSDEIVVREFEQQQDRQLWVWLELAEAQHAGQGAESTVECMVRIAHSMAVKAQEQGIPVGFMYRVADAIHTIPAATDRSSYRRVRDGLARVNAHAQLPLARWMQRFRAQLPAGGTWAMFNLGGANERAQLARIARRRSAEPLFVEFDKASFVAGTSRGRIETYSSSQGIVSTVAAGADLTQLFRP